MPRTPLLRFLLTASLLVAVVVLTTVAMAQPPPPGGGGPATPVPLDGGLGLLALAGGALAARRLRRQA